MSIYWAFLRLHLLWFILYNLVCIGLLVLSPVISLVLLTKLVGYPVIYLLTRPKYSRYDYYFKNHRLSINRLFFTVCLADLVAFSVLFIPIKLLF